MYVYQEEDKMRALPKKRRCWPIFADVLKLDRSEYQFAGKPSNIYTGCRKGNTTI